MFLTALFLHIGHSLLDLPAALQKYVELFRQFGPPPTGFTLTDFHKQDASFSQCPLEIVKA